MKQPKSSPSQATLEHALATTGRDGAIDFAAKVEASNAERLMLEQGEDFIAHDGGPIELTSIGLKRLVAGHVAGHDVKLPAPRIPGQQSVSWSQHKVCEK